MTASLALPFSATAATRSFRWASPFASTARPSIRSAPPLGVTRSRTETPPGTTRKNTAQPSLEAPIAKQHGHVIGEEVLQKDEQQNEENRRNIDPAQIGQDVADGPQHRLGQPVDRVRHQINKAVLRVHHIEG